MDGYEVKVYGSRMTSVMWPRSSSSRAAAGDTLEEALRNLRELKEV